MPTKLLTLIYDSSIEESMNELLEGLEISGFTKIYDVFGRGGRGPKMNTPVFPGTNNLVYLLVPAEDALRIQRAIRRLQQSYRLKPGVTIIQQDAEEMP